jgi:NADPH:quinone reductase-like Zn-dependent oxidoreductase
MSPGRAEGTAQGPQRALTAASARAVDRLQLVTFDPKDVELPDGFIRVDVRAVGLNFADIFAMQGLYSATPHGAFTPGLEFSGVVSEVRGQRAVEGWVPAVGDKVMGVIRFGGYTTSLVVDRDVCRPLPVAARLLP